jgi:hypothetical protein
LKGFRTQWLFDLEESYESPPGRCRTSIARVLDKNKTLRDYLRERVNIVRDIVEVSPDEPIPGTNLAIFNTHETKITAQEIEVFRESYQAEKLPQIYAKYDQLISFDILERNEENEEL